MLILTNTTDSIDIVLSQNVAANQMQCYAAFRDTTSTAITPSSRVIVTNNTTAVQIVQSPGASTQRIVDFLSVQNVDTSQNDVTIRFNDNGTTYVLFKTRLNPGDKIEYHEGKGFKVVNTFGSQVTYKESTSLNSNLTTGTIVLDEDVDVTITGSTSIIVLKIPKLAFPVQLGKMYAFKANILYDVNATTTGVRFNVDIIDTQTLDTSIMAITPITSTTVSTISLNSASFIGNTNSATSPATTENCARIDAMIKSNFDGTIGITAGHEAVSGATMIVKKGSMIHFQKLT